MVDEGRWATLQGAVTTFVNVGVGSSGVGLGWFPVDFSVTPTVPTTCQTDTDCGEYGPCYSFFGCLGVYSGATDSCDVPDYANPSVPVGSLSATRSTILADLAANGADGGTTPLTAALRGAVQYARASASSRARRTSIVIVTDGDPTGCTRNDAESVTAAALVGTQGSPQIKTYVVTLGTLNLDAVAEAGGTVQPRVVTTQAQLETALTQIRVAEGCL